MVKEKPENIRGICDRGCPSLSHHNIMKSHYVDIHSKNNMLHVSFEACFNLTSNPILMHWVAQKHKVVSVLWRFHSEKTPLSRRLSGKV